MKYKKLKILFVYLAFVTSCATSTEHIVHTEPVAAKTLPPAQETAVADTEPTIKIVPLEPIPSQPIATEAAVPMVTQPSEIKGRLTAKSKVPLTGVAPEQALKWLKNGNRRFTKGLFRNDGASKKDVERLAKIQKPHSIILSCSDSRVPPEVIFDQKLGEIFVVRTFGETLDFSAVSSIEYAVEHLEVRNIIVMGHSQCSAIKAALGSSDGQDAGSPNLNKLVADIHPRLISFIGKKPSTDLVDEGWANTTGVAKDLLQRSELIAEKVRSGDVKISTALYHLDSGQAEFTK